MRFCQKKFPNARIGLEFSILFCSPTPGSTLVLIFCALFSSGNATVRDAVNSDGLELNCEATKKKNSEKKKTAAHSHCEKPSFFVRKVNFCETLLGHFVAVCLHFQLKL